MKKNLIRILVLTFVIFMLTAIPGFAATKFISIATGSTGGTFYPVGVILASTFGEELTDSGYRFSAHTSGGSAENLEMLRNKEVKMAIVGSVPTANAFLGKLNYEGKAISTVRFVSALWPEAMQLVYRPESGIKTLADFKGKKIGVGPVGGADATVYLPILFKEVGGFSFDDFLPQYLGYNDSAQAMQNRLIDGCNLSSGIPTSAVSQLYAGQNAVNMIEFSDEDIAKVQKVAPYFTGVTIPKGMYSKQDRDLKVIGVKSSLVIDKSVDDEIVYKMLEVMYLTKLEDLQKQHGALKTLDLSQAVLGLSGAPLHPGAVKFYRDHKVNVPDALIPSDMK